MRGKTSAGILIALALLIPAAPAVAGVESPGLDASCRTVERKVYKDIRELVTIDLDTATNVEVRILANRILAAANTESLPVLPDAVQKRLDGTPEELRKFLKDGLQKAWSVGLRITVLRTLTGAGANVKAATQKALDAEAVDAYLAYLNNGLYAARALDCASKPTPTPSATPSATTTVAPSPTSSAAPSASSTPPAAPSASTTSSATPSATPGTPGGEDGEGEGGGLPVTGDDTGTVAGIGGALLLLGGAGYLIGRRRRSRFVA